MRKYNLQELDPATKDYLFAVRDRQGEGMPGLFVPVNFYLPIIGLGAGIAVLIATVVVTFVLFDDPFFLEPLNVAMLQTAGLLLGGWMVIAALRVWLGTATRRYLGHFMYADALHLYQAKGGTVWILELEQLRGARGVDNYNDHEQYQNTRVELLVPHGPFSLVVTNWQGAQRLVTFLNALAFYRLNPAPQPQAPALLGVQARYTALAAESAATLTPDADPAAGVSVPHPLRVRGAPLAWLAYLIIVGVAVGGVFLFREINTVWREEALFAMLRTQRPPQLRLYLVDERLKRYRDKVIQLLAAHYDPVVARLRQQAKDRELSDEFLAIVAELKSVSQPLISIRVREKFDPQLAGQPSFSDSNVTARERSVEERVKTWLEIEIGSELVECVPIPKSSDAELKDLPGKVDVHYRFRPDAKDPRLVHLEWTVHVRKNVENEGVKKTWTSAHSLDAGNPLIANANLHDIVEREARQTLVALVGERRLEDNPFRDR